MPITLSFLFLLLSSCDYYKDSFDSEAVARVFDEYLYRSDLERIIPSGISVSDSTTLARQYIDNWVKQQVLIKEANKNLPAVNEDLEKKIEDYKNSLLIYAWENQQVLNDLDTLISEEEINSFYENHKEDFLLNESIARILYIKVPLNAKEDRAGEILRNADENNLGDLEEYSLQNAAGFLLDPESWLVFNDLIRELPVNPEDADSFLKENHVVELTDEFYRYYLRILEYRLKGSLSPLAFERENVRNILLSGRKMQFLNEKRNELYQVALQNNQIETYN